MNHELATWHYVVSPEGDALLSAAGAVGSGDVAAVEKLRRRWPADAVRVALQLCEARRKANVKFPDRASILIADPSGVEQASSLDVARHKAGQFREAGAASVMDLCCGIGGDAMGFVAGGLDVLAVDLDPVRAWMAGVNAGCSSATCDAGGVDVAGGFVHLDPARRNSSGRVFKLEDTIPPPPVVCDILARSLGGSVKLSPAVDRRAVAHMLPPGSVEFISEHGRLVQAVLWTGTLAQPHDRATLITPESRHTLAGPVLPTPYRPLDRFVFTLDPALERSGLEHLVAEALGLGMPHPQLGLLTGAEAVASPWLTPFELLVEVPWQLKKVKRWLADHDAGIVEVKTRGKAVDPDPLQHTLRGKGDRPFTVFILRWDRRLTCLICQRIAV